MHQIFMKSYQQKEDKMEDPSTDHQSTDGKSRLRPEFYNFSAAKASLLLFVLFICTLLLSRFSDLPSLLATRSHIPQQSIKTEYPLQCTLAANVTQTCPNDYPTSFQPTELSNHTCPEYFKWIHEDLRPWKAKGITREMVESAKDLANFRLVIVDGKAYWEKYKGVYQTRDVFTIWGILQLLRLYPGQIPDVDIMFEGNDVPVIKKSNFKGQEENAPPMFHFCGDDDTLDIAFPDWSYWGWPEINIKGWGDFKKELAEGNNKVPWINRAPIAYWKGNPFMGDRMKLMQCNSADKWKAEIVAQDWNRETKLGFKSSNLADQCIHRFKIYIEGIAWSVSEKYILACDSMSLLVTPKWYEFFTRSLEPMKHYWPINPNNLCESIKFAVDWGNKHPEKAQEMGKSASKFVQEKLKMQNVYDYMFHLLNEYGKLLNYKPTVPPGAKEICSEKMACLETGLQRQFRENSMVKAPSKTSPCSLQHPEELQVIKAYFDKQDSVRSRVDSLVGKGDPDKDISIEAVKWQRNGFEV